MGKTNFIKSLFYEENDLPGKKLTQIFYNLFPVAKNVEWHPKNGNIEAIFYEDDVEKIAEFDKVGNCILFKANMNVLSLQREIRKIAEQYGEIMNTIRIERDKSVQFEIIVRDKLLTRYLLILDEEGNEKNFEKL